MKVLFLLTKRQPPSSRLRVLNCLPAYREAGIEPTVMPIPSTLIGRIGMLRAMAGNDVVVIQKKTSFHPFELALMKRINPRIVFDMDDAVMFHELEHHQPLTGKNFLKFIRTVNHCAAVVAGNQFLAKFAEPNCKRVYVLPTPIDADRYKVKEYGQPSEKVIIGWIGVAGNLHYLKRLEPVFQRLCAEFNNVQIKIVSNDFIDMDGVRVIKEKWALDTEIESLRSFDIGIMPLDDTHWARGKCGYKILQYMGVGVPVVASPVGINSEFIQHGKTGFLASSSDEWHWALRTLILEDQARKTFGLKGRGQVEQYYSQARFSARYVEIFHKTAQSRIYGAIQ
jgi:glycosyltransferase involved in cell wall biosynthesis